MLNRRILCAIALSIALAVPCRATTSFFAADEQDSALPLQPITASTASVSAANSGSDSTCMVINTVVCTQTQIDPSSLDSVAANLLLMVPTNTADPTRLTLGSADGGSTVGGLVVDASTNSTNLSEPPKSLWGRVTSMLTLNEDSSLVMGLDSFVWDIADHGLPTTIGLGSIALAWFVVVRRNRRKNVQQRPITI
jgi:hypothetical protein